MYARSPPPLQFMLCLGLFLMVVSTSVIITQSRVVTPVQDVTTTHMTRVTTSETPAPVSKSESIPNVENESQDHEQPVIQDLQDDDEGNLVKDKDNVIKSKSDATEKDKKGLVKEGSRHEPPIPFDVKEDSEKGGVEQVAKSQLHEKDEQGKETGEPRVEHEAKGTGKQLMVDEEEQKKLLDRLDILEQKVDKLSDDKKKGKEGESETDSKDTAAMSLQEQQKNEATAGNGTHRVQGREAHVTKSVTEASEIPTSQPEDKEQGVQEVDGASEGQRPVSVPPVPGGGVGVAKDGNESMQTTSFTQKGEGGPLNMENERKIEVDDSHRGKDIMNVPDKENSPKGESDAHERKVLKDSDVQGEKKVARETQDEHDMDEKPQGRTQRDVNTGGAPEAVKGDTAPVEVAQDPSLLLKTDNDDDDEEEEEEEGERKGERQQQDTVTQTDGTTANSDL